MTRPRKLVYAALCELGGHHSVDELVALLQERNQSLPRMTVYNVANHLMAAGLVMCADIGPGRAVYEASDQWHHHFVCRVCGRVEDVPCVRGLKPCLQPDRSFKGTVDEAQVIFRGRCEKCRRSIGENPSSTQ